MAKRKVKRQTGKGNFVLPSAKVAIAYAHRWAQKGVTRASDFDDANIVTFKSEKEKNLAKIRWREADAIKRDFEKKVMEWEACKAAGVEACGPKPKPGASRGTRRSGNFSRITTKQAEAYIKRLFGYHVPGKSVKNRKWGAVDGRTTRPFTMRLHECIEVLGLKRTMVLRNQALLQRATREKAQCVRSLGGLKGKKADSSKIRAAEKRCADLDAKLADLADQKKKLQTAAARMKRARSMKRSRSRSRSR